LNTFKRFRDLKQHELAQLYSKLNIKGKLTSQEIEARLKRAKGKQSKTFFSFFLFYFNK